MSDKITKIYAYDGTVRIYGATTTSLVEEARTIHDTMPSATVVFGQALSLGVIMGAMYKGEQALTIRVDGKGPLGGIMMTTNAHGQIRGYVGNPRVNFLTNDGKVNTSMALGNEGFIHVTKDLKIRDIFTSSSEIVYGEIASDFSYYFTKSEQIPSSCLTTVILDEYGRVSNACGFIIQAMPGCKKETLDRIEEIINSIDSLGALVQEGKSTFDILRILADDNYEVLEEMPLSYYCNCSKERYEKGLLTLGKEELENMVLEEKDGIEITCHFCGKQYHFTNDELKKLL